MNITNPAIEDYLCALMPQRSEVLTEMQAYGENLNFPIIGPLVGQLVYQLALTIGARRVLELGSGFGYSACWFALAIPDDGEIHCTEESQKNANVAKDYLQRAGVGHKVAYHVGDALELLEDIPGAFDVIFIDIDKQQYPAAFHKALPCLNHGGILITDNMLRSGRVLDKQPDESTRGVQEFTELLYSAPDLTTTILPLRDGVSLSLKQ